MQNSTQKLTLYVDGACRGNPGGIGGWGALILDEQNQRREYFGGENDTTNNRMELTAAIEGISHCSLQDQLTIYTDSTYVQKGITEWIHGWKKKNWKDVKNTDLWKKLDQVCQGRNISWHWIKGHAGHDGNERADQLANLGADQVTKNLTQAQSDTSTATNPVQPQPQQTASDHLSGTETQDWLLDDPFGFDSIDNEQELDAEDELTEPEEYQETQINDSPSTQNITEISTTNEVESLTTSQFQPAPDMHPAIKITPVTHPQEGERLLILDTETTGFYFQDTDRIVEVGAIEMINRRLTGSSIHIYINPQKPVGESENIHGISDEFLKDKPVFGQISKVLFDYLKGAEIVAHNANFDMNFLNMEFEKAGYGKLSAVCTVTDTLAVAKRKFPGQKNSLDALVKRLEIPPRDRTFHGALLDAEILADVYLAMTGGQVALDIDHNEQDDQHAQQLANNNSQIIDIPVIKPQSGELTAHQQWMEKYQEKNSQPCLFEQYTQV